MKTAVLISIASLALGSAIDRRVDALGRRLAECAGAAPTVTVLTGTASVETATSWIASPTPTADYCNAGSPKWTCSVLDAASKVTVTSGATPSTTTTTVVATACPSRVAGAIPSCAQDCLADVFSNQNCTGLDDLACTCPNFDALIADAQSCLDSYCSITEKEFLKSGEKLGCECFSASVAFAAATGSA